MLRWVLKILLILSVLHHFEMAKRLKISANTQRRFSFHHRRNFRTNRNEVELVPMDIDWEFANEMVLPLNRYLDSQVRTTISPSPYSTDLDPWESFCSPEWKKIYCFDDFEVLVEEYQMCFKQWERKLGSCTWVLSRKLKEFWKISEKKSGYFRVPSSHSISEFKVSFI